MRILELAERVESLLQELEEAIGTFKASTGISCKTGCYECCANPKVEATVLEFIPLAMHLHDSVDPTVWEKGIRSNLINQPCLFLRPDKGEGGCMVYPKRGLICRLFGYSCLIGKNGLPELIGCRYLKGLFKEKLAWQGRHPSIPIASHYTLRLIGIDLELGSKYYQINTAIQKAMEMVGFYLNYRKAS